MRVKLIIESNLLVFQAFLCLIISQKLPRKVAIYGIERKPTSIKTAGCVMHYLYALPIFPDMKLLITCAPIEGSDGSFSLF